MEAINSVHEALVKHTGIRYVSLMLEILSRRFFLKLNLSDHKSILADLQKTLKRRWRYLIRAESQIHNHMLIPNYQDIKFQDFRYSDGFECYQVIKIERTLYIVLSTSPANNLQHPSPPPAATKQSHLAYYPFPHNLQLGNPKIFHLLQETAKKMEVSDYGLVKRQKIEGDDHGVELLTQEAQKTQRVEGS
nr:hypothetical protein [Tanacetum cinerariifolium]